jgi:predicted Zn finger-like uncharacterized protein
MYTQCPDCSTAFRVTAGVLKQAAGKVRCGGCGNAFNALDYLSESLPEQAPPKEADAALPELKPEPLPSNGLPTSISAEQSAALLKTLDELAGSDIRIEDTGVEWRVLDDNEIGVAAADEAPAAESEEELVIDEILDESPTPVDQFLTETPPVVDSPEIFEEPPLEFSRTSVDEIRFDDNTPLPDDFDLSEDGYVEGDFATEATTEEPVREEAAAYVEDDLQVDLDLSEPGEWTDILGEFEDLAEAVAAPLADEPELETEIEVDALEIPIEDSGVNEPLDMDSQFALQAEAMGIDLSGMRETLEAEDDIPEDEEVDLDALLRNSKEEELELEDRLDEDLVDEFDEDELKPLADEATQLDLIENDGDLVSEDPEEDLEENIEDAFEDEPEYDLYDDLEDELEDGPEEGIEDELDDFEDLPDAKRDQADDEEHSQEHYVPPLTEEEQTINMQIDQDLLALAIEDDDGFASTIIIPEDAAEAKVFEDRERADDDVAAEPLMETGAGFETIIMEGEAFRSSDNPDKLEIDTAAAAVLAGAAAAERDAERAAASGGRRYGLIAGIVALLVLFAVQYVHQSRETLATIPAFNNAVGPLYRAIGQPLAPAWDITGWRFEVAKGTEEGDESLTIYSRLGNKSDKPLPYPLIGISLTDRFEETIGSRILDPADYLSKDLDPRKLVQPGNTFEAVMTIQSPAEASAGFRLRACYRTTDGKLRCKDDGFK